jgi:ATP-binding cassette subfamily B (MDR/TAP) protein 1
MQMATSQPLGLVLQYSCRSLASLGLGFYTSWRLSLVTLAGIPIFSFIIAFLASKMKYSITAQQAELTEASKIANNAITNIDTVKCLNGQAFEHRNFAERIQKSATHYLRQARLNSLQIAFIRWMMFAMFVQGFWYGSSLARAGTLTSGEVLRTFWACLTAAQSIEQILPQMIVMEKAKVAGVALKSIIQSRGGDEARKEATGASYPQHCEGDIEIKNVSHFLWLVLALNQALTELHKGLIFLSQSTRPMCSQPVEHFLPCWRNNVRDWEEWLWQKYSESTADAVLLAKIRRDPH